MLSTHFRLQLITPARTLFDQEVEQVIVPTTTGQITILPHHAALVSILAPGELIVTAEKKQFPLVVAGGAIEVSNNRVNILADSAEHPTEIDIEAAEKRAAELAKEIAKVTTMDITTYNTLLHNLERERARLAVGKKWRK